MTGPTGAGKSTLARQLSQKLGIPWFPLDEIHWIRRPEGDVRRPLEEKLAALDQLTRQPAWILEGVQFKWADLALQRADRILVLDTPLARNLVQILKRFATRGPGLGQGSRATAIRGLVDQFRWVRDYHAGEREELVRKLAPFAGKTTFLRGPAPLR